MSPLVCALRDDLFEGGLTLYTMLKLMDLDGGENAVSIATLRALSTETLERDMVRAGVPYTREGFLARTRETTWVLDVAKSFTPHLRPEDHGLVYLATCELWARLSPERPSVEMLDDMMQEGYYLVSQGNLEAGCRRWLDAWDVLRPRFDPSMRTMGDTMPVFNGSQRLDRWTEDMLVHLDALSQQAPETMDALFRWLGEWAMQFPDETPERQYVFYQLGATLLFRVGNLEEAEKMLFALTDRCPTYEMAYAMLADALANNEHAIGNLPKSRLLAYGILAKGYTTCPPTARDQLRVRMELLMAEGKLDPAEAEREQQALRLRQARRPN